MRYILLILSLILQTICYGQIDYGNKILTLNKLQGTWLEEENTLTTFEFNNKIMIFKFGYYGDWIKDTYDTMLIEISDTLHLIVKNCKMSEKDSTVTEYIISSHNDKIKMECEILELTDKRLKLMFYPNGIKKKYYKKR